MDLQIFHAINFLAGKYAWLDNVGIFLAIEGIYILIAAGLVLWVYKKLHSHVILATLSVIISRFLIVEPIKILVNRPRPYEIMQVNLLLHDTGSGQAFSSGHAVTMFAIAFSFYGTKWFWPMAILATFSSIARVFVGVHYPSDIVASIGIAGLVVWILRKILQNKKDPKGL
jgi:undecaprenyl-diphosphatase